VGDDRRPLSWRSVMLVEFITITGLAALSVTP
jgi:hypothetical protein